MVILVIWLFIETQRAVDRERRTNGKASHNNLRKERCIYALITIFFGLSYVGRFVLNEFNSSGRKIGSQFTYQLTYIIVYLLEGVSMGVLMLFHSKNFKHGKSMLSDQE